MVRTGLGREVREGLSAEEPCEPGPEARTTGGKHSGQKSITKRQGPEVAVHSRSHDSRSRGVKTAGADAAAMGSVGVGGRQ